MTKMASPKEQAEQIARFVMVMAAECDHPPMYIRDGLYVPPSQADAPPGFDNSNHPYLEFHGTEKQVETAQNYIEKLIEDKDFKIKYGFNSELNIPVRTDNSHEKGKVIFRIDLAPFLDKPEKFSELLDMEDRRLALKRGWKMAKLFTLGTASTIGSGALLLSALDDLNVDPERAIAKVLLAAVLGAVGLGELERGVKAARGTDVPKPQAIPFSSTAFQSTIKRQLMGKDNTPDREMG